MFCWDHWEGLDCTALMELLEGESMGAGGGEARWGEQPSRRAGEGAWGAGGKYV